MQVGKFNSYKSARNWFILFWFLAIVVFFSLVFVFEPLEKKSYGDVIGLTIFAGILFFCSAVSAEVASRSKDTKRKKLFANFFAGAVAPAVILACGLAIINVLYISTTAPKNQQAELIDCYVDGRPVKATRFDCAEFSKQKAPDIIVQQPKTQYQFPQRTYEFPDNRVGCTKCDTNYKGEVVCETYKAYYCN